jgi:glycosyltransferase involved in cell wall biosynthesis
MRIVVLTPWFSEKMGYIENILPKEYAKEGHEVHLVTSNVKTYFNVPEYKDLYEKFIGPPIVECGVSELDGYTVHRLPHGTFIGFLYIKGLLRKLIELRPDIVQDFEVVSLNVLTACLATLFCKFKLFIGNHICLSVSPWAVERSWQGRLKRLFVFSTLFPVGRFVSVIAKKCHAATPDCLDLAVKFLGVPRNKCILSPLGSDTNLFSPLKTHRDQTERNILRKDLGFSENDIVCIYTGRFTEAKNPMLLARAVSELMNGGQPYRGLFFGTGSEREAKLIEASRGCVVRSFVHFDQLPRYYRAADIGVWPREESTSMLDAAACGLPIIVSDHLEDRERFEGNGLQYKENDLSDLKRALLDLRECKVREALGAYGSAKIAETRSWRAMALARLKDYALE